MASIIVSGSGNSVIKRPLTPYSPTSVSKLCSPRKALYNPSWSLASSSSSSSSSCPFPLLKSTTTTGRTRRMATAIKAEGTTTIEKSGIKIVRNPPESKLMELGVRNWPKWGCSPSKFPWTYSAKETCYLLEGKVRVYPDGSDQPVEISAGDLVEFPKGMSCTWDVSVGVDKHYNFE